MTGQDDARRLVEHLFRRKYSELVATLTRILGPAYLDLAEDVVQDALARALKRWSYDGIPESPAGWLMTVARNLALDRIRRDRMAARKEADVAAELHASDTDTGSAGYREELTDDMLRMMFACCHPSLPDEASIALILRDLCGLSTKEIAAAYLQKEATIAQRLVRAKQRFKDGVASLDLPPASELPDRFESVLNALYLLFAEGYAAHSGESLSRVDLCAEAIRLLSGLIEQPVGKRPAARALLALFYFQAARLPSRVDSQGRLVELSQQDRSAWNRPMIGEGLQLLDQSAEGDQMSRYHLMAAIASVHAVAEKFDLTDWPLIVRYYDDLMSLDPSPVIALNRAVAVSYYESPEAGLRLIDELAGLPHIERFYLYHATRADLLWRLRRVADARTAARRARQLTGNAAEQEFLARKYQLD